MDKELLKQVLNSRGEGIAAILSPDMNTLLKEIDTKLKSTDDPVAGKKMISTNVSLFRIAVMNMGDGKDNKEEAHDFCRKILKELEKSIFNGLHLRSKFQLLQEMEYLYIKGCADIIIEYMESELPRIKESYWRKRYRDLINELEEDALRYNIRRSIGDL